LLNPIQTGLNFLIVEVVRAERIRIDAVLPIIARVRRDEGVGGSPAAAGAILRAS
jgi:hypothetical protein